MKKFASWILMSVLAVPGLMGADYGLPSDIQKGNILHCFNWSMAEVKANLQNIAAAGYGSVQLSPLQRADISKSSGWHDLYRPYDLAFKQSPFMGSEQDLKDLCSEAAKYGIKVIVDVVANHVDKTSGYHDTWWDSNGRVRWNGGINYGDRNSITHNQLGDYGDINSEASEVQARAKAYVQKLHDLGVKGIRWDAAKHIGLPSEGCQFWPAVTSVSGMYHYGEILDNPGPNASIIKEYAQYMSVTDNQYCNYAARENGGLAGGYGGSWAVDYKLGDKCVYWGESHDTYSNDDWSSNRDQATVDRAYACFACRNDATCLYFARPNSKGFNNIKMGKGTDAYKSKHIAEVNKFRNAMVGRADYFTNSGNAVSVTRKDGGAVIVMKGSGNVSIANGGGYCPAGTYTDRVSGGTFTVTATTISGTVGSSGIAVIYNGNVTPDPNPDPDPNPNPDPDPTPGGLWILGNLEGAAGWGTTPGTGVKMTQSGSTYTAKSVKFAAAAGETKCYFNLTDYVGSTWDELNMNANRYGAATEGEAINLGQPSAIKAYLNNVDASGCLSWTVAPGTYDFTVDLSAMTVTVVNAGDNPDPTPNPDPDPTPDGYTVYFNNTANWSSVYVWCWDAAGAQCTSAATWPGELLTKKDKNGYYVWTATKGTPSQIIFNGGSDQNKTADLPYQNGKVYDANGNVSDYPTNPNPNPDPDPTPNPANFWILGNLEGSAGWSATPGTGVQMSQSGSQYVAKNVKFVAAAGETKCYFNLTDYVGSTWDELNMNANRYGAATEGEAITLGQPSAIKAYLNNVDASGCLSWTVAPGTYDFSVDLSAMKLTVTASGAGIEDVLTDDAEPEYYNMQGIRVHEPQNGIYIMKKGRDVTKVYIR